MSVISKQHSQIARIAITGICTALYFVLSMWATIPIANDMARITFAPLVLIVLGALYGPADAAIAGCLGQFFKQMLSPYGITATTPLWTVPDLIRGLFIGLVAWIVFKKGRYIELRRVLFIVTCVISSLLTTVLNTIVMGLDGVVIYKYYPDWPYVLALVPLRLAIGVATAIVLCIVSIPVLGALRRAGFGWTLPERKQPDDGDEEPAEDPLE